VHGGGRDGAVKFSPDGRWLVVSSTWGFVVYRTDTGAEHYRVRFGAGFTNLIVPVGISADGRYLAVGVENGGTIFIHDIINRQLIRTWKQAGEGEGHSVFGVAFSPDGARLAIASERSLTMWQVETGTLLWRVWALQETVAFSPDRNRLVTAGNNGVLVFDAHDGSRRMTLVAGGLELYDGHSCEYTADGTRLLISQGDAVRLLDASSGQELLTLPATQVKAVTIAANGRRIAYSSRDGLVHVIDVPSAEPVIGLDPEGIVEVLFSRPLDRDAVIAQLKAYPALAANVRAAALELAAKYPETRIIDALWKRMWCCNFPIFGFPLQLNEPDEVAQQLRLSDMYLRQQPGDKKVKLNRAVALFHLGRYQESEELLQSFTIQRGFWERWTDAAEGYRLGFRVLALVRMGKDAEARSALEDFNQAYQKNESRWATISDLPKFEDTVRRAVPPPPIPRASD
jgi:hypothetical protein